MLKIDVDERRLGLGVIGLVENPEEVGEHNEVLRGVLSDAGMLPKVETGETEPRPKVRKAKAEAADAAPAPAEPTADDAGAGD